MPYSSMSVRHSRRRSPRCDFHPPLNVIPKSGKPRLITMIIMLLLCRRLTRQRRRDKARKQRKINRRWSGSTATIPYLMHRRARHYSRLQKWSLTLLHVWLCDRSTHRTMTYSRKVCSSIANTHVMRNPVRQSRCCSPLFQLISISAQWAEDYRPYFGPRSSPSRTFSVGLIPC